MSEQRVTLTPEEVRRQIKEAEAAWYCTEQTLQVKRGQAAAALREERTAIQRLCPHANPIRVRNSTRVTCEDCGKEL